MASASAYAGTTILMTAYVAHKVLRVGVWRWKAKIILTYSYVHALAQHVQLVVHTYMHIITSLALFKIPGLRKICVASPDQAPNLKYFIKPRTNFRIQGMTYNLAQMQSKRNGNKLLTMLRGNTTNTDKTRSRQIDIAV